MAVTTVVMICGCGSVSHLTRGNPVTFSQFDSLKIGESHAEIVKRLGVPESRQRVVRLGFTHEEPSGQRCIYYRRRFPDIGDPSSPTDTFQLCFRRSLLRYKWAYITARA